MLYRRLVFCYIYKKQQTKELEGISMAEKIKINVITLQDYISQYKASFAEHRFGTDNEIYKWKAVKCFQDNWDIDAPDFSTMLKSAMAKTFNLLASNQFFPRKLLSENIKNFGIAHSDMYQMYVYGKKYNAEKVVLIYPLSENIHGDNITFESNDGIKVEVFLIDLLKPDINLSGLLYSSALAN
jgi:hypothetical protein